MIPADGPAPTPAEALEIEAALLEERLRLYRDNVRTGLLGQASIMVLLVTVLWRHLPMDRLLPWLGCLALAMAARYAASRPPTPGAAAATAPRDRLFRLRLSLAGLGLAWGLAGVLFFPVDSPLDQVFLSFLLAGMAAGTLTLTAFDLVAAMSFCVLALIPLGLRLLAEGGATQVAMTWMVLLFVSLLSMAGLRAQRDLRATVTLRTREARRAEAMLRNQTRLQQLSDELTAKTQALELTLDSMAQGILSIGADRRTHFHNRRLLQLLDLPEAFMAARPTLDDIARYQFEHGHYGDGLTLVEESARGALMRWMQGDHQQFPSSYFRRTPAGVMLEVKSRYLSDGAMVRTFTDVTPYFDAQQKLSASEAQARKLALVAAHTDNAVAITDDLRRIEWVNEGFIRMTGYSLDEAAGRQTAELLRAPLTDVDELNRILSRLGQGQRAEGELLKRAKDGREFWCAVEIQAILDEDGQVRQYIETGRDVSERKAAEQALRSARDEAQRASQAKSEFLSAMSHELRTPMNAILGFGQLLASDPGFVLPERQQGQVREILRAGAHLLELINDVLDLARVEAGKQPIQIGPVAVEPLLDECLALMRPVAQERGIRLEARPPDDCGCHVAADRVRIKQVLLNLLSNAVKYNRDGGTVRVECLPDDGDDTLKLTVSDTGPGLDTTQRERLFEAFERLGAENGPIQGAGIGLVLSKRMVELMGGSIGVDSEPGRGSHFWVRLPLAQPPVAPKADERPPPPRPPLAAPARHVGQATVLYIEDNPVNLLLMEAMLEQEPGVRLITALDPALGLALARTEQPRLILLDIQLPGIDGFEVLRRLRSADASRSTPVVAISANAMESDIRHGLDAGFDDYLTKPLDLDKLRATVRQALQRG